MLDIFVILWLRTEMGQYLHLPGQGEAAKRNP
jgi:hypothetical protein